MATVLKSVAVSPLAASIHTLGMVQRFAKQALPDAETIVVELPNVVEGEPWARLVVTLKPLAEPAESLFVIRRNLVNGCRLGNPVLSAGDRKRHVITVRIEDMA